jgi:hypothetical protein
MQPLVEAFLVVEQPRQRSSHWTRVLASFDAPNAPALASIVAYYDADADQALLALRYDELALGPDRLAFVIELALLNELGMIQPAELSDADRRRFIGERLSRCTQVVRDQRSVVATLVELVRRLRDHRAAVLGSVRPRGESPILLVAPKATRNNLEPLRDHPTVEMDRADADKMRAECATGSVAEDAPQPPTGGMIYARYLRSGRWVPIRVGALSLKGAALLAGALPRLHDQVDLALAYGSHRALVRGPVRQVSPVSQAATFSVAFELDDASRRQLTTLLHAARAANVVIKPPPARRERRFPVEWPVCLGTVRGAVRADALDVSRDGLFVRTAHALEQGSVLAFSSVLDDGASPVSGRARVVRQIVDDHARTSGLSPGYGMNIVEMNASDLRRWHDFVARVEQRADKRIVIGAAPARLTELQSWLAAAGYAVSGGSDASALVQLAHSEARPVDAALLDAAWLAPQARLEQLFVSRNVPFVTIQGDARRARAAVDKLLSVC